MAFIYSPLSLVPFPVGCPVRSHPSYYAPEISASRTMPRSCVYVYVCVCVTISLDYNRIGQWRIV